MKTTDMAYVQAMLWHLQRAQELASLVQGRTHPPGVAALALRIRTAQGSDAARMVAWLRTTVPPRGRPRYLATEAADRWFAGMLASTQLRTLAASGFAAPLPRGGSLSSELRGELAPKALRGEDETVRNRSFLRQLPQPPRYGPWRRSELVSEINLATTGVSGL